jgi:hypothetical protein
MRPEACRIHLHERKTGNFRCRGVTVTDSHRSDSTSRVPCLGLGLLHVQPQETCLASNRRSLYRDAGAGHRIWASV